MHLIIRTHAPSRFILPTPSAGYSTAAGEYSGSPWLFTNNTRHRRIHATPQ